ncbi:MAG: hypothetical protein H6743_03870 [Rickettsiaceae bacterium]|nr:hypothetical protein [Rickettsiaceae bacterium]
MVRCEHKFDFIPLVNKVVNETKHSGKIYGITNDNKKCTIKFKIMCIKCGKLKD